MTGAEITIGIGLARGDDLSAVFRAWRLPGGQCLVIPDYLPSEWLDRITPVWGDDGKWHYLWTGWNNGQGHAKVRRQGKAIYCHRDIVERVDGIKLARFQYVDHKCARKNCLNYYCLEVVPPGVNTQRGPGALTQFKPGGAYLDTVPSPGTSWVEERFLETPRCGDPLDGL